jgi:hypothetical protein
MEYGIEEVDLCCALAELDSSRALMLKSRADLNHLSSAGIDGYRPSKCSPTFNTANQKMNEAAARYRRAVESFNTVCLRRRKEVPHEQLRRKAPGKGLRDCFR